MWFVVLLAAVGLESFAPVWGCCGLVAVFSPFVLFYLLGVFRRWMELEPEKPSEKPNDHA